MHRSIQAGPTRTQRAAPTAWCSSPPPSSLPRGRHPSRSPGSLPPVSSALLPGFASFAFPRLPAPRQSDLRTQPRQRLPPRRETPPPAALLGRGRAGAPAESCRGEGGVPRAAEGLRRDLNPRPQILSGARVGRGGSTGRRSLAPEMEPLLGTRAPPTLPFALHPHWRGASPLRGHRPRVPCPSGGLPSPPAPLPWPPSRLPSPRLVFTPFTHL